MQTAERGFKLGLEAAGQIIGATEQEKNRELQRDLARSESEDDSE